ncbi:FHA domain-containing protein [Afifella aestuarii]|uniref:FHA domain-containing protein n=1 Tax=Afifella aestuarii TaxID=1909496 RepID=UPI000FE3A414|nr:FHA domain-containing protein [Afifella aestuarii]
MRLELRQTAGQPVRGSRRPWTFERGRRSLGGSPDCDWIVEDQDGTLSDFHCIISRDHSSFVLEDRSAHGIRVDSNLLRQGETARLASGSVIAFGALIFEVTIYGEPEPDLDDPDTDLRLSDEAPTISSILADVAPGRQRGSGLSGAAAWDDGEASNRKPDNASARRDTFTVPSSREVEIGWSGPPETDATQPLLPNDWNADAGGDYASNIEHRPALSTAVPRMGARRRRRRPDPAADIPDDAFDALAPPRPEAADTTSGSTPEEHPTPSTSEPDHATDPHAPLSESGPAGPDHDGTPDAPPLVAEGQAAPEDTTEQAIADILGPSRRSGSVPAERTDPPAQIEQKAQTAGSPSSDGDFGRGETTSHLLSMLRDCEDSLDEICRLFGLEISYSGAGPFPGQSDIGTRIAALTQRQTILRETMEQLLRELGPRLEPRALEARVDASAGTVLPWPRRDYWRAYRAQFRQDGRDLSVQEFLKSLIAGDEDIDTASSVEDRLKRSR